MEQVGGLGVIEQQSAGDCGEYLVGDSLDVAFLQAGVPIGAHPGQDGDLLAA
jgi:hypothetical protein